MLVLTHPAGDLGPQPGPPGGLQAPVRSAGTPAPSPPSPPPPPPTPPPAPPAPAPAAAAPEFLRESTRRNAGIFDESTCH